MDNNLVLLHCSSQRTERSQDGLQREKCQNLVIYRVHSSICCFSRSQFLFQAKFLDGVVLFKCGQRFNNLLPLFS